LIFPAHLGENRGHTSRGIEADHNINRFGGSFHVVAPFLARSRKFYATYTFFFESTEEEELNKFLDIPMDAVEIAMRGQLYHINEVASMLLTNVVRELHPQVCVITGGKHTHA
jgi:hypothetical protein